MKELEKIMKLLRGGSTVIDHLIGINQQLFDQFMLAAHFP